MSEQTSAQLLENWQSRPAGPGDRFTIVYRPSTTSSPVSGSAARAVQRTLTFTRAGALTVDNASSGDGRIAVLITSLRTGTLAQLLQQTVTTKEGTYQLERVYLEAKAGPPATGACYVLGGKDGKFLGIPLPGCKDGAFDWAWPGKLVGDNVSAIVKPLIIPGIVIVAGLYVWRKGK